MKFASDNWAGAAPEVMQALVAANEGAEPAYGGDPWTRRAADAFNDVFERECAVYFVGTGGAANGLALSCLAPPYGSVVCHEAAHVQMDECAGPEFFTGGAKLIPVPGAHGKLAPGDVETALAGYPSRPPHGSPFAALTITQGTEYGTVYAPAEIAALTEIARAHAMKIHMDGARFANAVVAARSTNGAAPADLTWRAGVDVLSFGGTKNGCLAAEAVVFFDPAMARDFEFRRKRAGQLFSKSRFLAAQFIAYFDESLWLRLAARANAAAARLSEGIGAIEGCRIWAPTEINEVFASFPASVEARLKEAGAEFYPWVTPGDPADGAMRRLICSWATDDASVDRFLDIASGA
ncbi:MAG: low specificity L-threonine aldolase [Alphaproteobacteria bacterium]|nr:low specificity L-threonine aldolase [Alphaproteobacteria bacterium]